MMGFAVCWSVGVNQRGDHANAEGSGGRDLHDPRPTGSGKRGSCRARMLVHAVVRLLVEGPHVVVAQGVVDVFELAAGGRDDADVVPVLWPRRAATRSRNRPTEVVWGRICTDSTTAQRTSLEPCLVIRPW